MDFNGSYKKITFIKKSITSTFNEFILISKKYFPTSKLFRNENYYK